MSAMLMFALTSTTFGQKTIYNDYGTYKTDCIKNYVHPKSETLWLTDVQDSTKVQESVKTVQDKNKDKAEAFSKAIIDTAATSEYTYSEIVGTEKLLSKKVTVEIDFGQKTTLNFFGTTKGLKYIDPATGKPVVFNSMVDAMNFMGKNGWEFIQAFAVTEGSGGLAQNVYHFLLKRNIELQ
jgi:hypothetical protein